MIERKEQTAVQLLSQCYGQGTETQAAVTPSLRGRPTATPKSRFTVARQLEMSLLCCLNVSLQWMQCTYPKLPGSLARYARSTQLTCHLQKFGRTGTAAACSKEFCKQRTGSRCSLHGERWLGLMACCPQGRALCGTDLAREIMWFLGNGSKIPCPQNASSLS